MPLTVHAKAQSIFNEITATPVEKLEDNETAYVIAAIARLCAEVQLLSEQIARLANTK